MFTLRRKKMLNAFLGIFVPVLIIAISVFFIAKNLNNQTNAAAGDGSAIRITDSEWISYDEPYGHGTNRYWAVRGSSWYQAYCANPYLGYPSGDREVKLPDDNANNDKIKFLVYVSTVSNSHNQQIMNALFRWAAPGSQDLTIATDRIYALVHIIIGGVNGDYYPFENYPDVIASINATIGAVEYYINNNDQAWQEAEKYQLMGIKSGYVGGDPSQGYYQNVVWIEPKYGNIQLWKYDLETAAYNVEHGTNKTLGSASLSGISFVVCDENGANCSNPQVSNSYGYVVFTGLQPGRYVVKETATNTSYLKTAADQSVEIVNDGETKTLYFGNQVIRGDVKFVKKDKNANTPMANVAFRIESSKTHESHIVVTNSSGVVNTANSHIPHNQRTNCYDSTFQAGQSITDQTCGTWFGLIPGSTTMTTVNNNLGALPYDTYTIYELACTANQHCTATGREKSFTVNSNNTVVDLGDWENTCNYTITTEAYDGTNGNTDKTDKFIVVGEVSVVKDEVSYCAAANTDYKLVGKLIRKDNDATVASSSVNITTGGDGCGTTTVSFTVLPNQEPGINYTDLVVYEYLQKPDGTTLASHEDKNSAGQTIYVYSLATRAGDNKDEDKIVDAKSDAVIKDEIDYCLMANQSFTIKGELIDAGSGEPVKNNGTAVQRTLNFSPNSKCGQIEMTIPFDATEYAGKEIVVYQTVYYGNTNIVAVDHRDQGDLNQTVMVFSIDTIATDTYDGDHIIDADIASSRIKDTIDYCFRAGREYTIRGILVDKRTGQNVKIDGHDVKQQITFTPTENCGRTEMFFDADYSQIAGAEVVAFEYVDFQDNEILAHTDINDDDQTIDVFSLATTATDTHDGDHILDASREDSNIKDTIRYCVKPGETYKIKGILMNKNTGESLKINNQEITKTIQITPATACGQTEMIFEFDTTYLGGTEIVVFETLEYKGRDVLTHANLRDANQTVDVYWIETLATDSTDGDKILLDEEEAHVRDIVDYCLKAGETYTIKSIVMNTKNGLPLEINGEKVETSVTITPTTSCGFAEVNFDLDTSELAGYDLVMFEELFYQGRMVLEHSTLHDKRETFSVLSLNTNAEDLDDGDKLFEADDEITIKDRVDYCLIEGKTFTIEGVVMDKTTKSIVLIDGAPIRQAIEVTPEEACGSTVMTYKLNTNGLGGHELVIFESLYYDGDLILAHEDFSNEPETVSVLLPPPDTGLITNMDEGGASAATTQIVMIVLATLPLGYLGYKICTKKKLSHHRVDFN